MDSSYEAARSGVHDGEQPIEGGYRAMEIQSHCPELYLRSGARTIPDYSAIPCLVKPAAVELVN